MRRGLRVGRFPATLAARRSVPTAAVALAIVAALLLPASALAHGTSPLAVRPLGSPSAAPFRTYASGAYDARDGYVLFFGGADPNGSPTAGSYAYLNGGWTALPFGAAVPPPRFAAAMVYDPNDREIVLFGGCADVGCYSTLGDTWIFAGGQWTQLNALTSAPPARGHAMFAWDAADGYAVLFGGGPCQSCTARFSDTWAFVGNRWTNLTGNLTGASPPAREDGAMASLGSGPVVLFGGQESALLESDTWSYSNRTWTDLTATVAPGPSARKGTSLVADPADGYLLLFGGYSAGTYFDDAWSFSNDRWSSLPTPPVGGAFGMAAAFDGADGYPVYYGGQIAGGITNAVVTFEHGQFALLNPTHNYLGYALLLLPVGAVVLLVVLFGGSAFVRRRREAPFLPRYQQADPGSSTLIRTQGWWMIHRDAVLTSAVLGVMFFTFGSIFLVTLLTAPNNDLATTLLAASPILLFLILPIFTGVTQSRMATRSIEVTLAGVVVGRKVGKLSVPWSQIDPPKFPPRSGRLLFRAISPDDSGRSIPFWVTREQALAILTYPTAPAWNLEMTVRSALGLAAPSPPGYAPPMAYAGAPGPAGPAPFGLPPPPPPGPPPPYPVGPPLRSGTYPPPYAPPPPPPTEGSQLRRCPSCRRLVSARSRFCASCGAPMP